MPEIVSILLALSALGFLTGAGMGIKLLRTGRGRPQTLALTVGSAALTLLTAITFTFPAPTFHLVVLAITALCSSGLVVFLSLEKRKEASLAEGALESLMISPSSPAVIVTDCDGIILLWSRAAEELFGYSADRMKGTRKLQGLCPPAAGETADPLSGILTHSIVSGEKQTCALQALAANGACPWVQFTVLPQSARDGTPSGVILLAEDISDRMEKEEWLRDRAASFRELAESFSDMFFALDADARCTYWNRASENIFGVSERDAVGKEVRELFGPRTGSGIDEFCLRGLHTHEHDVFTTEIETGADAGTETRTFEISTYPTKTGISVFGRDITWRKQAYDQLLYQSNILKNVLNSIIVTDLHGHITYWNHIAARTFGYEYEELRGKTAALIYPGQDEQRFLADVAETAGGTDWVGEWEGRRKDGSHVWVDFKRTLMRNGEGNPIGIVGVSVDITERKLAQRQLEESERKKRAILNALPDLMLVVSADGTILESKLDEQVSLLIVPGPYTGRRLTEVFATPLDEMLKHQLTRVIAQKAGMTFEFRSGADMLTRHYEARMVLSGAAEVLVLIRDITERRQAEEELQSSLREKEALLKEIHHRVKNNLQIISSLLSLQAQQIKNPKALSALTESQGRVRSMALIHEQLYQSHDLGQIDFGQYVRDLTAHLFRTYKSEGEHVTLSVEVEGIFLDVDQAIPCGMIINELVSNCLKHAFPRQRKGVVHIAARRERDGQLCLVVEDSGKGIPVDVDLTNTTSLGLKLVRMLSDQLKGTLTHTNQGGTSFHLCFRPHPVKTT